VPAKGGEKSYRLLVEIMARANKAGLAKFVLHEREYFVTIKSMDGALALITLHYSDEILAAADMIPKEAASNAQEKTRFKKSIEKMLTDFDPTHYADARREKILALLKEKIKKTTPVLAPEAEVEEGEGPADLIAALEESMRQVKQSR
jgi:DNA end-binding protein Ku